jgi:hypothetical protein
LHHHTILVSSYHRRAAQRGHFFDARSRTASDIACQLDGRRRSGFPEPGGVPSIDCDAFAALGGRYLAIVARSTRMRKVA